MPFERAAPDASVGGERASLSVLVVDDHDAQRMALAGCARQLGWSVQVASDGEAALAATLDAARRGEPFDVVVLDWKMPGLDGVATLARLHEQLREGSLAAPCSVLTTAYDTTELRGSAFELGADVLLPKPVTTSTLFDAVLQAMARRGRGAAHAHVVPPSAAGQRLPGVSVLVADDSAVNRDVARRILELEGATVLLACDGAERFATG